MTWVDCYFLPEGDVNLRNARLEDVVISSNKIDVVRIIVPGRLMRTVHRRVLVVESCEDRPSRVSILKVVNRG